MKMPRHILGQTFLENLRFESFVIGNFGREPGSSGWDLIQTKDTAKRRENVWALWLRLLFVEELSRNVVPSFSNKRLPIELR